MNSEPGTLEERSAPPWIDCAGWAGTASILLAHFLASNGTVDEGLLYFLLNLFGGAAVANSCFRHRAWQPLVLNGTWAAIAAVEVVRLLFVP